MSAVQDLRERLLERISQSEHELERFREALAAYDGATVAPARAEPGARHAARRRTRRPRPAAAAPQTSRPAVEAPKASRPASAAPKASPAAGAAKRAGTRKPPGSALEPETIEGLLGASREGLSVVALARRTGVGESVVRERMIELERSGQVRSSGSRRTSLWQWISDEQRIAERAAELARASGSSA